MGQLPSEPARPLGGRYQIIQQLGEGGFGKTFLAQDLHLPGHPRCVVKQLKPQVNTLEELQVARRLFDTEAQVLYRLGSHPHIPSLLAHFEEDQEFYLAQELIDGHSLESELAQQQPWGDGQTIAFLHDLLSTLAFVHHNQVIHRDLKPSNLIRRHSDQRIVVIDFGAVKQVSTQLILAPTSLNRTISIGTQGYMPSEQLAGRPQFSSDVYAAGMIAIQGLTGRQPDTLPTHPHSGELAWHDFAPQTHPSLVALIDYMVQYDFRSRYGTAGEALKALEATFPEVVTLGSGHSSPVPDPRAMTPDRSPSRAVQTVAVGRQPRSLTTQTPRVSKNDRTARRSRAETTGNPLLPFTLGLLGLLGLGLLAWQLFLSDPDVETADPGDAPTDVAPEPRVSPPLEQENAADTPLVEPPPEPEPEPEPTPLATPEAEPEAEATPEPAPEPEVTPLNPDAARATVGRLYSHVSTQSWDAARGLFGESLAQQFDPEFFQQFQQVTVDNLRVTRQNADTIELIGRNTYYYPDGTSQQEERTFTVRQVDGQPRIVGSDFVQVIQSREED